MSRRWWLLAGALLMAALLLCGTAFAQQDPDLAAAPPAPTVAELRALLAKIDQSTDSAEDARSRLTQINAIGAQADKFVAARTGELNDLNARLGELGNPPAAGASEDPDITRQRAALMAQYNAVARRAGAATGARREGRDRDHDAHRRGRLRPL